MLNTRNKLCKTCNINPRHTWRTECVSCIKDKEYAKAKLKNAKDRANQRINVRLQGVDEEDRETLREVIKTHVWPFLKTRQIQIKVSKGKVTSERKKLVKELDRVFSLWIRKRDWNKCVMCGTSENVQNGHLFSRANLSTRWDEINCNAQCWKHNIMHENDSKPYTDWFIKNYGQAMYDDLRDRWHWKPFKVTNDWIKEKIEYYSKGLQ